MKNSFNIQKLLHYKSKHHGTIPMNPLLVKSFSKTPRTRSEASRFGGSHNITTKQNKLPSFIDRLIYHRICKKRTYPHNTHFYPQITKNILIEIARFPHPIYKFTTSVCDGAQRSQIMLELLWMIAIFGSILLWMITT
jgi:hypothetical protein